MIGERFNFEDVFFRDLTVCVLDTLEGEVRWVNKFSSGDRVVNVPFYYSLTGDERFLLDSFTDDVVSNSRYVDLNTDIIPRGHLTLTSYEIRADEFANPNVWLKMVVENDAEIRNMLTKVRAIPITVRYELQVHLSSEIDTFKCSQAILDTLWLYRFMYFEYNFMNIDAVMTIPDSSNIEINREKNLTSDNTIKLTVAFDVQTYYPAFRKPKLPDNLPYTVQTTPYYNKTLSVKVDVVRPGQGYYTETLATCEIVFLESISTSVTISLELDYPEPNSTILDNFNFTQTKISDQVIQLRDYINSTTEFTASSLGYKIIVKGPPSSGSSLNGKKFFLTNIDKQISVTEFDGGCQYNDKAGDVIYSENHFITTSSDGSMVIQIGAGASIIGSYLNMNLNENGLKVNVYVDPDKGYYYKKIICGDDLPITYSNNIDPNQALSNNYYTSPPDGGDFRDIIIMPKRTRWYNNMINLKSKDSMVRRNPYNSQDLNNQKKI
jgi:hypothetical protein